MIAAVALAVLVLSMARGRRDLDALLAPLLGWLAITPIVARALDLDTGLACGSAVAAAIAWRWPRDAAVETRALGKAEWAAIAVVFFAYGWVAIRTAFHDELIVFGHRSMTAQVARGAYPPFIPAFPGSPARYHVGFDLLAGLVSRATTLPAPIAIDVVSLGLVALTMAVWAQLHRAARGEPPGAFARLFPFFAGGLASLAALPWIDVEPRCLSQIPRPACADWVLVAPPISVWFQHPVSLGLPLALLAMGAAVRSERRAVLLACLAWPALAIAQIAYLALAASAAVGAAILLDRSPRALARVIGPIVLGLAIAQLQGGFFEGDPLYARGLVALRETLGFPAGRSAPAIVLALTVSCGIGVLLLPWALFRAIRAGRGPSVALGLFALAGLIVPQLFDYLRSPDIAKFPAASAFVLPLVALLEIDPLLGPRSRAAMRALLVSGGVVSATFAIVPWFSGFKWAGPDKTPPMAGLDAARGWLVRYVDPRVLVVTTPSFGRRLAIDSGQAVLVDDGHWGMLGLDAERTRERQAQLDAILGALEPADVARSGARWLLVPPGGEAELPAFPRIAERVREGLLVPTATLSGVRVYRFAGPSLRP